MATAKQTIKNWFKTALKPTQQQFWDVFDSYFHKDDVIPTNKIENLDNRFNDKADQDAFASHLDDLSAHGLNTKVDKEAGKTLVSAAEKAIWNGKQDPLSYTPEDTANKNIASGYAGLDNTGKVPASLLPSYVDDVLEFANLAAFPATGESGKLYIAIDNNKTYRWSGSVYILITSSPGSTDAVPEGALNLYFTIARVLSTTLTGINTALTGSPVSTDSILDAFGKINNFITNVYANAHTWAAKQTFALSPRFNSVTASQYLKVDASKDLISSATIPATDIAEDTLHRFWTDAEKSANNSQISALAQAARLRKGSFANKSVVTLGSRLPYSGVISDGTETTQTSKLRHKAIGAISDLQLYFANYEQIQETALLSTNDITVEASIEYPAGTFTRVTFRNGDNTCLIKKNGYILSDYVPIEIPKDAYFWVRTNVLVTAGQKWIKSHATGNFSFEGSVQGSNLVMSGAIASTSAAYTYSASLVLGVSNSNKASIFCFGDSISANTGDNPSGATDYGFAWNNRGLYGRAFQDNFPLIKANNPGQKVSDWSPVLGFTSKFYGQILSAGQFAISNLGINDITAGLSFATMQTAYIAVWSSQKSRGIRIYQTTITPRTSSTDGWTTVGNQTPNTAATNTVRVSVNNWLRDGAPMNFTAFTAAAVGAVGADIIRCGSANHPLTGFFEIADLVESARDSGLWKANFTADGLHPTELGYLAAYVGIDTSVFTV